MTTTKIYSNNGFLNFSLGQIASLEEYLLADRCQGSIFESLKPSEVIELKEGKFELDGELDPYQV